MTRDDLMECIAALARVPSFTTHEARLHKVIHDFCAALPGVRVRQVAEDNLVIHTAAAAGQSALAVSAHLDKINHFADADYARDIPAARCGGGDEDGGGRAHLQGLLDDAAGVGICLYLLHHAAHEGVALQVLLSECEEGSMFRGDHAALLRPGHALHGGIGAERIAAHLLEQSSEQSPAQPLPRALIVVDVTPLFRGAPGIALYAAPWEFNKENTPAPAPAVVEATAQWAARIKRHSPRITDANNTNDYLTYARAFQAAGAVVPCLALEPSVQNYHSADEKIAEDDIADVAAILWQCAIGG